MTTARDDRKPPARHDAAAGGLAFSGPPPATILTRRDFLACARGARHVAPGVIVQARARVPDDDAPPRAGYTCSKKVGNAVARNRAKRRLREAARAVLPRLGRPGWDYVLIGRAGATAARPFAALLADLEAALARLHRPQKQGATPPAGPDAGGTPGPAPDAAPDAAPESGPRRGRGPR